MTAQPLPLSHTQDPVLLAALGGLAEILPPIRYTAREGGEADFYGASDRIAGLLEMDRPLFTGGKASWTHGWSGHSSSFSSPRMLVEDAYRQGVNLVDTEAAAQFLREHGYNGVAVGAPFIYADEPDSPARLPSSLLIFPPHSTTFSSLNATAGVLPYVQQVVKLKERFKTIVASIGGPDVVKGNWIRAFEAAGIPWVCGAWVHDRNGLVRMQRILRSFEFITTNVFGSHVAYAAYCGCRVVFHGENRELTLADVASHPYYRDNPELVEHLRDRMFDEAKLRERFPFLFCDFENAPDLSEWGQAQIGAGNRKSPREIAGYLGWNLRPVGKGWRPVNPLDGASNFELLGQAAKALSKKRLEEVFAATDVVNKRQLQLPNVQLLRGLAFHLKGEPDAARAAINEELRLFPHNQQAQEWAAKIGSKPQSVTEPQVSAATEVEPCDLPVVIVRSHEHNYSETFLEDHVKFVSKQTTLLYGYPFPRFVKGRSVLSDTLEQKIQIGVASGSFSAEMWSEYSAALTTFFAGCGARVALVETGLMGAFVHEACERAALRFVVHFHGLDAFGRELLERWQEHYQQFFQTAAQLVVVSEAMRTQLIKLGAPAERVVLAPYGVAVDVAAQAKPAQAGPRFLAVGRFVEKKAPHVTLAAFGVVHQKVPTARLTMIGDGPMLAACRDWAAKNGLTDAVTFAGVQSREEVSRHMAASGVFVQHSVTAANGDSEGLPLAVLEAGAHGLPVVSTQHAGIPDAVRDGVDGLLVAEKDVKGMALAMLRLAQNPALAAQLGASFRTRVGEHYSRKVSIQRLQGLLIATTDAGSAEAPSELDRAFAAIAEDRNDRAAYVKFAELRLQDGALADAYCAMGELHRITGGGAATQDVLQTLEAQGVREHSMVQSYRQRAGWIERRMSEQPQRVLVVTNLLPPQEMGGYGRTMWEFSRELAARGHTVQVLTADMPHLLRQPTAEHEAFEVNVRRALRLFGDWKGGAAVVEPDQAKRNEIARANHQLILAAAKEFQPDVVMVGNLDFIGHFFVQELLNRGVPVLHRLGNASPGFEPAAAPKSPLYCLAGCSEWVNAGLREKGYPFTRYAVLAPGSPLSEYFRAFPPQRKALRIAFASLLMPYKGAHVLMEALDHLHRAGIAFECTFAGDSTSAEYLEKLKAFAVQQGFMSRLRFPGFLAKAELAALYARCNTLVFPSVFEEPFGKTQIEAMAAGLTVISSGNGGALDIIRDGENGLFFKNNDARDLAEKLAHVHREPDAAAAIALAGQEDAFRFTTAASVDRLEEILNELVSAAQEIRDAAPERVPAGV